MALFGCSHEWVQVEESFILDKKTHEHLGVIVFCKCCAALRKLMFDGAPTYTYKKKEKEKPNDSPE